MSAALFRIITIARNTLLESVRQKVLSVLLIFVVVMVGASVWFSGNITSPGIDQPGLYDAQIKFVKDTGCGCIEIFGAVIVVLSTAQLIPQELHNRTIYTILAKPVRRAEFFLGKFFGVVLLLVLCMALMTIAFAGTLYVEQLLGLAYVKSQYGVGGPDWHPNAYLQGLYDHDVAMVIRQVQDPQLIKALLLIFSKLVMVCGIAMLISTFATSAIFTIVTTLMIYLIGYLEDSARVVWLASANGHPPLLGSILASLIAMLIPNLYQYGIVDEINAGNYVPWSQTLDLIGYAWVYLIVLLGLGVTIFEYREI